VRSRTAGERVRWADSAGRPARIADRGAGTVAALGIVAFGIGLAVLLAPISGIAVARHRAAAAADAAALAAAGVLSGFASGDPCGRAAEVAAAGGTSLHHCDLDGLVATVAVAAGTALGPVLAVATAGPP